MNNFQKYRDLTNDLKIIPLSRKLYEMKVILDADIPMTESPGTNHLSFANESESQRLDRVKIIEEIFDKELTFLFYLNLNNIAFSGRRDNHNESRPSRLTPERIQLINEMFDIGSPKDCLMTLLTKDNDIKRWFAERIDDIMHYRKQTLNKMSEFYDEILDSSKYIKKEQNKQSEENSPKPQITFHYLDIDSEEYDIAKICNYQ